MGGPGVYEPMLPEVPGELSAAREAASGYLRAHAGQKSDRYRQSYRDFGSSLYEMMAPPDFFPSLLDRVGDYTSSTDPSDEFFAEIEAVLQDYFDNDGYPVHANSWYTAAKAKIAFDLETTAAKINENAIITGARYGTGVIRAHAKEVARKTADLGVEYAKLEFQGITEAYNRELVAAGIGVDLAKERSRVRFNWLGGVLQAGVAYWQAEIQRNQIAYMEWKSREYEQQPAYRDLNAYAMSYPFQSHAPTVTPNPMMQLLQGVISGGSQIASAAILK